jgi:hypothetical protein
MKDSILGTGEKGAAGVHEVGKEEKLDTQLQKSMCLRLRGTPHPRYLHRPRKAHSGNGQDIISGNSEHYANILLDPITILQSRYYNDSFCLLALQLRKVGLERMSNFSKAIKYLNPSAHTHTHTSLVCPCPQHEYHSIFRKEVARLPRWQDRASLFTKT